MLGRWLAPGRRGMFLILLGAALGSAALTVGVALQGTTSIAVSAPEPVAPTRDTPAGDPPPGEPTATRATPSSSSPTPTIPPIAPPFAPAATPSPTSRPTSTRAAAPPDEPVAAFRAVAGPACPVTASRNVRRSAGWQVVPGDSWTGDGCGNRFLYSPPDDPNYLQWRFAFAAPADRTCQITVFVPDSPLASARVRYGVADRFEDAGHRVGGFTVDQEAGRGRWVNAGTVSVGTDALLVNVTGEQGPAGVTAGPLRVVCSATEP